MTLEVHSIHPAGPRSARGPSHAHRLIMPDGDFESRSPFLRMVEDWFRPPSGFPTHPHRGMETVTVVLDGQLVHEDHTGGHGVLDPGDVQFMTAGSGVLHSEMPGPDGVHTIQLWLNLPAERKAAPPQYTDVRRNDAPVATAEGVEARLYSGKLDGAEMPHGSTWPLTLAEVAMTAGAVYNFPVGAGERAFLYALAGDAMAGETGEPVGEADVAWAVPAATDDALRLEAVTDFRALVYASPVIHEPVVAWGPFVMNSMDEIERAVADYNAGTFIAR